jgi:hypothetical protein
MSKIPQGHSKSQFSYLINSFKLIGFVDSDWAGDEIDRKSTTGFIFFLGTTPISWQSKKQNFVALYLAEADYVALFEIIKEGCWIMHLLNQLKESLPDVLSKQFTIYEDNQSCIALAKTQNNITRENTLIFDTTLQEKQYRMAKLK